MAKLCERVNNICKVQSQGEWSVFNVYDVTKNFQ